ncbi:MAG TPA: hypothetical protein VF787_17780, partial [Thermoanaerobaculia bacterium]
LDGDVDAHRTWMRDAIAGADRVIVDTFPAGIPGELSGVDARMELVARSLRWDAYRRAVSAPLPRFDTIWSIEPLEAEHESALRAHATSWRELDLRADDRLRACRSTRPVEWRALSPPNLNYWLIVHSGPADEVRELVAHAEELGRIEGPPERVLVATRCAIALPEGFELIDAYPVTQLFAGAEKIISAAGFNIMLETESCREKHHPVPFARRYDDQYARAMRRRTSS